MRTTASCSEDSSPRRWFRRPRLALLCALGFFVLLQVGLRAAIDGGWLAILRDPDYVCRAAHLKHRLADAPEAALTVVALGSSRTALGLKAKRLEGELQSERGKPVIVFNFGVAGAGSVTQYLYLRRLLAEGIRPDLFIIEVLPPLLTGHSDVPVEARWLPASRLSLRDLGWLKDCGFPLDDMRHTWWEDWPVPWYGHRFSILSRLVPAWLPMRLRRGWGGDVDDWGEVAFNMDPLTPERYRQGVEQAHREYSAYLDHFRLCGSAPEALRDMLDLCRHEHIPAALVMMPEGAEFRSWYPPPAWRRINGFLHELSRSYAVPLVNAREWMAEEDFSDSHHLTSAGALKFTERLARQALPPVIAQIQTQVALRRSNPAHPCPGTEP